MAKNKSAFASPEHSIEQIKGKIREFLVDHSETSALRSYESHREMQRTDKEYHVGIFKKNAKKRVNLKFLDEINPELLIEEGKLRNEVNISEAFINPRQEN